MRLLRAGGNRGPFALATRRGFGLVSIFLLSLSSVSSQHPPIAPKVQAQRQINRLAAALASARFALIEETGLRRPEESLPEYAARIAAPLPGETHAVYNARIQGYLNALQRAAAETASGRRMPLLRDTSEPNRARWQRICRLLSYLPDRMVKLRAAGKRAALGTTSGAGADTAALGSELLQTLQVCLTTYELLRDARP